MHHPEPERVAVAWLKSALSLTSGVATSLPSLASWPVLSGQVRFFIVVDGVVGGATTDTHMRRPIVSVSVWAAMSDSDNPQWGAASEVMADIMAAVLDNHESGLLSWPGYGHARVSSTWLVSPEPRRVPDQDSGRAHYVLDLGLSWAEVES